MYDSEIEEWKGEPFIVGVPANPESLWRLVTSDTPTKEDFLPDCDARDRLATEDWCSYLGFSAFRLPEQAGESAELLNPLRTGPPSLLGSRPLNVASLDRGVMCGHGGQPGEGGR
jgi:hypothetical protein